MIPGYPLDALVKNLWKVILKYVFTYVCMYAYTQKYTSTHRSLTSTGRKINLYGKLLILKI